jgi:hypothetical protein
MQDLLNKTMTRGVTALGVAAVLMLIAPSAYVQAADSKTLSVSQQEISTAQKGWSWRCK